ncbi:MAG: hypothetical protein GY822_09475 [Deltaproteobacteria bacterium]|nr:hypothetical protein [Deltaproteobacteria bacterium]
MNAPPIKAPCLAHRVTSTSTGVDLGVSIRITCIEPATEIDCAYTPNSSAADTAFAGGLSIGDIVFIVVDGAQMDAGEFNIEVSEHELLTPGETCFVGGNAVCNGRHICADDGDGSYSCQDFLQPLQVSAGETHACALLLNGVVRCWGANFFGQLGNGGNANSSLPVDVVGITNAVAISAGGDHSCALLSDGTAKCWGRNQSGQLGDGTANESNTPVVVAGLSGAKSLSANNDFGCALMADDSLKC